LYPIIVTTGDTIHRNIPFDEFYVFHQIPDVPFLYRRTRYGAATTCGRLISASSRRFSLLPESSLYGRKCLFVL
jgi:hypothetical protein